MFNKCEFIIRSLQSHYLILLNHKKSVISHEDHSIHNTKECFSVHELSLTLRAAATDGRKCQFGGIKYSPGRVNWGLECCRLLGCRQGQGQGQVLGRHSARGRAAMVAVKVKAGGGSGAAGVVVPCVSQHAAQRSGVHYGGSRTHSAAARCL